MAPVEGTVDMPYLIMPSSPSYMKLAYLPQLLLGYSNYTSSSSSGPLKNNCITSSKPLISPNISTRSLTSQIASNYPALSFSNISNVSTTQALQNPLTATLNASISHSLNITADLNTQSAQNLSSHALGLPLQSSLYNSGALRNIFRNKRNLKRKADFDCEKSGIESCDNGHHKASDKMPLYCKCCRVTLNAQAQAKQHFEGKSHSKKLRLFVDKDSLESPNETSDSAKSCNSDNENLSAEENPEVYCKICGVSFNSSKQANQHYSGKSHAKRARIVKSPNSSSAKEPFKNKYSYKSQNMKCDIPPLAKGMLLNPQLQFPNMLASTLGQTFNQWNPANKGFVKTSDTNSLTTMCNENVLEQLPQNDSCKDYTMFRTPSGYFYCALCDLTLNSCTLFTQHIGSKRHKTEKIIQT